MYFTIVLSWIANAFASSFDVLEIGDSNVKSTQVNTVWAGDPVHTGFIYRFNGVNSNNYPSSNNPGVAKVPYAIDLIIADGHTSGHYVQRGTSGATTKWPNMLENMWAGAQSDMIALGALPELVIINFGINNSKKLDSSNAYQGDMVRLIDSILAEWPDVDPLAPGNQPPLIAIAQETTSNAAANPTTGVYKYLRTTIYAADDVLDATYPAVYVVKTYTDVPAPFTYICAHCDTAHWTGNGIGYGQQCVADLVWAQVVHHP